MIQIEKTNGGKFEDISLDLAYYDLRRWFAMFYSDLNKTTNEAISIDDVRVLQVVNGTLTTIDNTSAKKYYHFGKISSSQTDAPTSIMDVYLDSSKVHTSSQTSVNEVNDILFNKVTLTGTNNVIHFSGLIFEVRIN